mgnify:CR=1 FL=1
MFAEVHLANEPGEVFRVLVRLDTGFVGMLMLLQEDIETLSLAQVGTTKQGNGLDGRVIDVPIYSVDLWWNGEFRKVTVLQGVSRLLGVEILTGLRMTVEFQHQGVALLEAIH